MTDEIIENKGIKKEAEGKKNKYDLKQIK